MKFITNKFFSERKFNENVSLNTLANKFQTKNLFFRFDSLFKLFFFEKVEFVSNNEMNKAFAVFLKSCFSVLKIVKAAEHTFSF